MESEATSVYLIGKITDDPDYLEKFAFVEKELFRSGYKVVNPTRIPQYQPYDDLLDQSMKLMEACDAVFLIYDWIDSFGGKREYLRAVELGKLIMPCRQTMYICDPIKAMSCDKEHCYVRVYNNDRRCAFTPRPEWARRLFGGIPVEATTEAIERYRTGASV